MYREVITKSAPFSRKKQKELQQLPLLSGIFAARSILTLNQKLQKTLLNLPFKAHSKDGKTEIQVKLEIKETSGKEIYQLGYDEAIKQINLAKDVFGNSELFGLEKDESFKSSLSTIYQTFEGKDLYPSIEEKAANLLYFITKNHSFTDGNKRIAAFLFLFFLERNKVKDA